MRWFAVRGTDHGYGNPLLVLGGAVNGRKFYGIWPGLNPEILSPTLGDVLVATDYRLDAVVLIHLCHGGRFAAMART